MKFDMPKAVFGGLALIAAAIYFGPGSQPVEASGGIQKVVICKNQLKSVGCGDIVRIVPFDQEFVALPVRIVE